MTQNNEAFEKWFGETYKDLQFNKAGMTAAWQAATQASESEINSLKQRVDELQADNLRLRDALEACKYDCNTGEIIGIARDALATVRGE